MAAGWIAVAAFDGPAVARRDAGGLGSLPHDPIAGREPWQRLTVPTLGEVPKRGIGGMSAWQMAEDRTLLSDLARTPFAIPVSGGAAAPAVGSDDAVDRIAAWLLGQPGMKGS